ncbi:MAG: helix-turn-helix domain-containing protein [Proteobacteria bacterium]|nr:helix-turn-helix domain-containing protein [Pseudomonadota bacterium]
MKLLDKNEVSEMLGITIGTLAVWRTTKRYNLPYVKAGRLTRYRESDVLNFINSRIRGEVELCNV